jgi:5-methyltetrahydrofolate--homocysteine methyltransferase
MPLVLASTPQRDPTSSFILPHQAVDNPSHQGGRMIIIGEKINGTRKAVAEAIKKRDSSFIKDLALSQVKGGAHFLDVNAGTHPDSEPDDITWLVNTIQEVTEATLCIDSANPKALLAGINAAKKLPMLNSLSGEKARIQGVLPLASQYGTELVVLALDDNGIPKTAEERLEIVRRLVGLCLENGLIESQLYVDPLVTTIATDNQSGIVAFETIRRIKQEFPNIHVTCGLSNISFGQPSRGIINQAFAALAIGAGLDSAIVDPNDGELRNIIYSAEMVLGQDQDCMNFNQAFREGHIGSSKSFSRSHKEAISRSLQGFLTTLQQAGVVDATIASASDYTKQVSGTESVVEKSEIDVLEDIVESLVGMKKDKVKLLTEQALASGTDPLLILDASRRAMSEVGHLFETEEYFVPELILAGRMLKEISDAVKPYLSDGNAEKSKKGRVIIGTVAGDIHDIGKDIVVTMLDINGYEVLDLGVDVPNEKFVEAARDFKPDVIGLSGFLTLAYDPMKDTIAAIREENAREIKFMIGGGQIDEHVREYTQADAYGNDAMDAVRLCEKWMNAAGN